MAVTAKGEVYSWGHGGEGRLGHGDEKHVFRPQIISALEGYAVKSIACGGFHTVACMQEQQV